MARDERRPFAEAGRAALSFARQPTSPARPAGPDARHQRQYAGLYVTQDASTAHNTHCCLALAVSPIADHTAVIFSDESQGTGLALLRVLVSDMSTTQGDQYLRSIAPAWVTDCVFKVLFSTLQSALGLVAVQLLSWKNWAGCCAIISLGKLWAITRSQDIYKTREAPKLHFLLNPQPTASQLPSLPQGYAHTVPKGMHVSLSSRCWARVFT